MTAKDLIEEAVKQAFKDLIEEKHLYQRVSLDSEYLKEGENVLVAEAEEAYAGDPHSLGKVNEYREELKENIDSYRNDEWQIKSQDISQGLAVRNPRFSLPTVKIYCAGHKCKEKQTYLPDTDRSYHSEYTYQYTLHYKCSYCNSKVVLLISRRSSDLILCGRYPMERVICPKYIPKDFAKYYSDSVVAYNSGQILPAIFMLRVFIEQYMRSITGIDDKTTGDTIADAYAETLDTSLKGKCPSLKKAYDNLSMLMHNAKADARGYEAEREDIESHFEQLEVHNRRNPKTPPTEESDTQDS